METVKLFYEDQYIKSFEANIINVKEKEGKYYITLDKTAFFPGGGGQDSDAGTIDGLEVISVIEEKNEIIHILKEKPKTLENVSCKIDWKRRYDGMQQHLGQHVLSGCFYNLFNANTAGIHLGKEISTVDIVGNISEEQIIAAERKANEIILENHKVEFMMTSRKEAKSMGLRRELATKDQSIRVVKIQDLDINACCGVHPRSTLELQIIRIKSSENHKGNTRIEFLAGNRAVLDYLDKDRVLNKVCNTLSASYLEVEKSISNLLHNYKEVREENSKLKVNLADFEVKELVQGGELINNVSIIKKIYVNENIKFLTKLASRIVEDDNKVILFASKDKEKANLIFSCSKNLKNVNMGTLLKDAISLID
jgi:alanyl-tRNA synthetase